MPRRRSPYRYKLPEPARLSGAIYERRNPSGSISYRHAYYDAKGLRHVKSSTNRREVIAWRDATLVRLALAKAPAAETPAVPAQQETSPSSENLRQELVDIKRLLQGRHARERNEHESLPAILRRVTEIERHLRLTETPVTPKPSRRHPVA